MKIFSYLMRARIIPQEPVPFQEILPLKLKPVVSGKGNRMSDVSCIYEMSVMFACFKENEFAQSLCNTEVDAFQKCYYKSLDDKRVRKDRELKGVLKPGEKNLTPKQVNILLNRHPNL